MILNSNPNNTSKTNKNSNNSVKANKKLFEDKYLLNKEDPKLIEFLKILIEISVEIVVDFYMNKKYILLGGYLEHMKDYKNEILNKLINIVFDKNAAKNSYFYFVFDELNKKFSKYKMVINKSFIFAIYLFQNNFSFNLSLF